MAALCGVPGMFSTIADYECALLAHARNQADGSGAVPDYSEAFGGGSHAEYKMEKEFEQLVAGTEGMNLQADAAVFQPRQCVCLQGADDDEDHAADCPGTWLRTLNRQACDGHL